MRLAPAQMELNRKRILVVGLGKSGVAAALFLRKRGAQVTVSDSRSEQSLAKELPALLDAGIMVEAGGHGLLTFRRQDLIVVSPGVPTNTPELVQARSLGVPVIGELELASRFLEGGIIAITGSNGKTTTTTLVGEIFKAAGVPTLVGGNIGLPVIQFVEQSTSQTVSVLEVSSFQLETTEQFHPRIAVILNITPDHLDRHGNLENYIAAKQKIAANQTANDALVLNADDDITQRAASRLAAQGATLPNIYWFSRTRVVRQGAFVHDGTVMFRETELKAAEPIMPVAEISLKGTHNVENVLAAVCAARLAAIPAETIRATVAGFKAVEHRLEFVAKVNGVEYYNDSKATNVDATIKALESFPGGVHLILGGKDKDSDYSQLDKLLRKKVRVVYTIGSAAEKIETQLAGAAKIIRAEKLEQAVTLAGSNAVDGEIVLLAPACASFDQFESYEHRGRAFKQSVAALQKNAGK
ncbi:MAG TPA: UDP-N-acetylmuramoyl-L-alanine--D-glutamate ligase [Acidobacteriaceae bacterium]|nr:UDP-N-acetylmuramoyl-L-alanine--D-glutamate ligase [Acidobacteriaceae bacterium]